MRPLYRLNDEASKGPRRSHACLHAQSCLTLCDPIGCSLPGSSSVHGILQARILGWVAISYFRGSSPPRDRTHLFCVSCIDRWILYHWAPGDPTKSIKDVITAEWASEWVKSLSRVWLFATPWTLARQVPLSTEFPRQEYWSGLPLPSPGDLPDLGTEPRSPALQADTLLSEPPGKSITGWGTSKCKDSSGRMSHRNVARNAGMKWASCPGCGWGMEGGVKVTQRRKRGSDPPLIQVEWS